MADHQRSMRESGYYGNFSDQESRISRAFQREESRRQAQDRFNNASQNLQDKYGAFQTATDIASTIMNPFKESIQVAATFEKSMSKVQAVTLASDEDLARLSAIARDLGRSTQFTAAQAADAQYYLGLAGWNADQIVAALPGLLNVAAAGDLGIAKTADIISDEMTALGLDSSSEAAVQKFADQIVYTFTHSNTDIEQMHEAMKYVAPVASAANMSTAEIQSMVAMMANAGIKGSSAGTASRATILRVGGGGKNAKKAAESMGVSLSDAQAMQMEAQLGISELLGLEETQKLNSISDENSRTWKTLEALSEKFKDLSEEDQLAYAGMIAGVPATPGFLTLMKSFQKKDSNGIAEIEAFRSNLEDAGGTAESVSKKMSDNVIGAQNRMESAMESIQVTVGLIFRPIVRQAYETAAVIFSKIDAFFAKNTQLVQALGAIAAGIATIAVSAAGLGILGAIAGLASSGFALLGAKIAIISGFLPSLLTPFRVLAGFISSIPSLIMGIPAVIRGIYTIIGGFITQIATGFTALRAALTFGEIKTAILGLGSSFISILPMIAAVVAIVGVLALAGYAIYKNWDKLSEVFGQIGNTIGTAFTGAIDKIQVAFAEFQTAFSSIDGSALDTLINGMTAGLAGLATFIGGIAATIISTLGNAIAFIINIATNVSNVVSQLMQGNIKGAWDALFEGMKNSVQSFINIIKSLFEGIWNSFSGAFDSISSVYNKLIGENAGGISIGGSLPESASIEIASANMESLNNATQNTSTNLQTLDFATQNTSTNLQTLDFATQTASTKFSLLDTATQQTSANMSLLDSSSQATSASIMNMSASTDQVSSALSSKAAEISAIQINVPTISIPAGGVPIAHNALGGIYNRGSFLTTFAEKSPEAAIPIDGSQRAQDLWLQTGQLLGLLPNENAPDGGSFNPLQPSGVFNSESQVSNSNPVFNLSINVNGNSDQSIIDQIGTSMRESFEDMWRSFQYERERVAFS